VFLLLEDKVENSETSQEYDSASTDSKYGLAYPNHIITLAKDFAQLWGTAPNNVASLRRNYLDFFNSDGNIALENILVLSEASIKNTSLPPEKKKKKAEGRMKRVLDYDRSLGDVTSEPLVPFDDVNKRELALYELALQKQNTGEIASDIIIYHPYKKPEELVRTEHQKIYHPYWKEVGVLKEWHKSKGTNTITSMFVEFPDEGVKKLTVNFSSEYYTNSPKLANHVWGNYDQTSSVQRG
jgi:hypothetical protein|tara:strand:+ start:85 stop:804 length:720 start_codon:yes stop_codon:yes gene_type:complete